MTLEVCQEMLLREIPDLNCILESWGDDDRSLVIYLGKNEGLGYPAIVEIYEGNNGEVVVYLMLSRIPMSSLTLQCGPRFVQQLDEVVRKDFLRSLYDR